MLRRVALVRTDVSEEHSASIIRVTRIGEVGTKFSHFVFLRRVRRVLITANCPVGMAVFWFRSGEAGSEA
jgi:hypothetical protein